MQIFPIAHSIVMHLRHSTYSQNDLNAVSADVISQINPDVLPRLHCLPYGCEEALAVSPLSSNDPQLILPW